MLMVKMTRCTVNQLVPYSYGTVKTLFLSEQRKKLSNNRCPTGPMVAKVFESTTLSRFITTMAILLRCKTRIEDFPTRKTKDPRISRLKSCSNSTYSQSTTDTFITTSSSQTTHLITKTNSPAIINISIKALNFRVTTITMASFRTRTRCTEILLSPISTANI